jgi:hypothetical protein
MALEPTYYISSRFFRRSVRGKIFLHVEMSGAKFFGRPYLIKKWILMEQKKDLSCFFLCFDGVFSTCRNVSTIAFLHVGKRKLHLRRATFSLLFSWFRIVF